MMETKTSRDLLSMKEGEKKKATRRASKQGHLSNDDTFPWPNYVKVVQNFSTGLIYVLLVEQMYKLGF